MKTCVNLFLMLCVGGQILIQAKCATLPKSKISLHQNVMSKDISTEKIKREISVQERRICRQGCMSQNQLSGASLLNDEIVSSETTTSTTGSPPPHTAQYIIDDLRKPTTTAPQSYLRSLCLEARGVFAHPLDCRKFVDCWYGRVREKYCPDDQVFSDLPGGFCDYLEYVDCGDRPLLQPVTATTMPAPTTPTYRLFNSFNNFNDTSRPIGQWQVQNKFRVVRRQN